MLSFSPLPFRPLHVTSTLFGSPSANIFKFTERAELRRGRTGRKEIEREERREEESCIRRASSFFCGYIESPRPPDRMAERRVLPVARAIIQTPQAARKWKKRYVFRSCAFSRSSSRSRLPVGSFIHSLACSFAFGAHYRLILACLTAPSREHKTRYTLVKYYVG